MKAKMKTVGFWITVASLFWGFQLMLTQHLVWAFQAPEEDLSHGWLVPVVALYILFREHRTLFASLDRDNRGKCLAAILTLGLLFLGFVGTRGAQLRFEIVAFAGLLWTVTWLFWGWGAAKQVAFPCAFLLFCIPLNSFLDVITVHLRLFATGSAFAILKAFGADVIRQGTMISNSAGSFAIDVASPCSGLRSIFALMTLTAAYAYFFQPTWGRRAILFLASIPLAILGNMMRILTIVAVASWCDAETATGFYHDYSGFVVFLVAVGCMLGLSALLNRLFGEDVPPKAVQIHPEGLKTSPVYVFGAIVLAVMIYQSFTPEPVLTDAPEIVLTEIPGYDSQELEPSEPELQTLPADTIIVKRAYWNARAHFTVSCVIGGRSKGSLHRPELCLPSQGFQMVRPRTLSVGDRSWRMMDIERGYGLAQGFAYTFFNQDGYGTSSHTSRILRDTLDRSLKNRYDRWVMVTVGASTANPETMREFLAKLEEVVWKN